jgi:hypothetical protein
MSENKPSRRRFLKKLGLAAAVAGTAPFLIQNEVLAQGRSTGKKKVGKKKVAKKKVAKKKAAR